MTVAEGELQQVTNKFYMFSSLLYLSVFISSFPDFDLAYLSRLQMWIRDTIYNLSNPYQ